MGLVRGVYGRRVSGLPGQDWEAANCIGSFLCMVPALEVFAGPLGSRAWLCKTSPNEWGFWSLDEWVILVDPRQSHRIGLVMALAGARRWSRDLTPYLGASPFPVSFVFTSAVSVLFILVTCISPIFIPSFKK